MAGRGGGREDVNSERSVPGVASRSRSRMRNSKIQNFCSSRISQGTTENSALEGSAFRIFSAHERMSLSHLPFAGLLIQVKSWG